MRRIGLAAIILMTTITVSGCGAGKMEDSVLSGKTLSQTEDTPWNSGYTNVMETEDGYYYNIGCLGEEFKGLSSVQQMNLRYYDKASGTSIILCNKPECTHTVEEGCAAVYNNMKILGTVLYDGSIYVYGIEENDKVVGFSLYRIAADGSSLDKVGTAFSAENTLGQEYEIFPDGDYRYDYWPNFCIHKGYAFLPYRLQIGQASRGFMGAGLVKMNLLTGETETLYEIDTKQKSFPYKVQGSGDYVYVSFSATVSDAMGGMKRYSFADNTLDYIDDPYAFYDEATLKYFEENKIKLSHASYDAVSPTRLYNFSPKTVLGSDSEELVSAVFAIDAETGVGIGEETFTISLDEDEMADRRKNFEMLVYEQKLFLATRKRVCVYDLTPGESYGNFLGDIAYELENERLERDLMDFYETFKISGGKLYHVHRPMYDKNMKPEKDGLFYNLYTISACNLEDLYNDTAKWEKVFTYECCRE